MVLILAQPAPMPETPPTPWVGTRHEWIGWDGSIWHLNDGTDGLQLLVDGVEGLHFPKIQKYKSTSRNVAGARRRGWRAQERDVFWPLLVQDTTSSAAFVDRAARFFRTIHPSKPGTWRVGVNGTFRSLQLTGVFEDSHSHPIDPVYAGWSAYKVALEADEQPYWAGDEVTRGPWVGADEDDFFNGGGAPPFFISRAQSLASASITNPGDVDSFPRFRVEGALSGVTLGIGSVVIDVPFSVDADEVLLIDTDPRRITATLDGVDVTSDLGFQPYAAVAIPPGESVILNVAGTGAGSISCSLTPLYFRAF